MHFAGQVQGVGFRFTAVSVAQRYRVTGNVQNLADGRVVILAEGEETELDRYLADLRETMREYIRDVQSELGAPTGEFRGFRVSH